MGSSVSPEMRRAIERAFTGRYREDYGSAEFGDMACDCPQQSGLHLFMDLFVIEIVRHGRPARDNELGKVLVTDLTNRAMPFVRYEIGDVGRLTSEPCPCGRASPRIVVEGRWQDTLVADTGEVFTNDRVMDFFYPRPDVQDFQLVEKRPRNFELLVVPPQGVTLEVDRLTRETRSFLGQDAVVKVFPSKTIRPEESGKFRFVKSCTYEKLG